jgi:hypothetical protein
VTLQNKVTGCPAAIVDGDAVKETITGGGTGAGVGPGGVPGSGIACST